MEEEIRVGNEVRYRGAFGVGGIKTARVTSITLGGKEGTEVDAVPLDSLKDWDTLSLDNHHWIYGYQIIR